MKRESIIVTVEMLMFDPKKHVMKVIEEFLDKNARVPNKSKTSFIKVENYKKRRDELIKITNNWLNNVRYIIEKDLKLIKELFDKEWIEITLTDWIKCL